MRIVVTGASGNIGTSVTAALVRRGGHDIVGVSRRVPDRPSPGTTWVDCDVAREDLTATMAGADAVIHLAWRFHPTRRPAETWHDNIVGTERTLVAAAAARVAVVVVASSIGAYSPAVSNDPVGEPWPTHPRATAAYGLQKSYVERILDGFEARHPDIALVRIRPAFTFKSEASPEQRRIFAGPFLPGWLLARRQLPIVPIPRGLRFQVVHTDDLAEAFAAAVECPVAGAFNIAADPVVDGPTLARLVGRRAVEVSPRLVRGALAAAFRGRLVPTEPGLFDLFSSLPIMAATRARVELGWSPQRSSVDTLVEFLAGLGDVVGAPTPLLSARAGGPLRIKELISGVGARELA